MSLGLSHIAEPAILRKKDMCSFKRMSHNNLNFRNKNMLDNNTNYIRALIVHYLKSKIKQKNHPKVVDFSEAL
jgi:hypothetical protein